MQAGLPAEPRRPGLFGTLNLDWYRTLSGPGRLAFWSSSAGYALASADALALSYVLTPMGAALGVTPFQVGLLVPLSLVATVIGGVVAGTLADRRGRVPILLFSIGTY